jgi:hypothetical protein
MCRRTVSAKQTVALYGRLWRFVSGHGILFPRKRRRRCRRLGSNAELLSREAKNLVLAGPFRRQVSEASNAHSMGESALDRGLDEIRSKEGKRDRLIDFAYAAVPAFCDSLRA